MKLKTFDQGIIVFKRFAGRVQAFGVLPSKNNVPAQLLLYVDVENEGTRGILPVPEEAITDMAVRSFRSYPKII